MVEITVCVGSTCYLKGSYNIINRLIKLIQEKNLTDKVVVKGSCCLGNCCRPVSIKIDNGPVLSVNEDSVEIFFKEYVLNKLEDQ